jgi:hypothetical protein
MELDASHRGAAAVTALGYRWQGVVSVWKTPRTQKKLERVKGIEPSYEVG